MSAGRTKQEGEVSYFVQNDLILLRICFLVGYKWTMREILDYVELHEISAMKI